MSWYLCQSLSLLGALFREKLSCLFRFVMQLSELQQKYKSPHFWIMLEKEFKVATSPQTCYLFMRLDCPPPLSSSFFSAHSFTSFYYSFPFLFSSSSSNFYPFPPTPLSLISPLAFLLLYPSPFSYPSPSSEIFVIMRKTARYPQ